MIVFRKIRFTYFFLVLSLVASTFLTQPAQVQAQGDWRDFSADVDGDGVPNVVEDGGWTNAAGGPFVTSYLDPDSDNDGLTDGQEKLYDTNPLDAYSPGVYVEYQNELQTREYFPWRRHGSKYIALSNPGPDSVVVRRGSTFSVGGPPNAQLQIYKSYSWLTTLSAEQNMCSGRWDVHVPADGTVGIYTITMQDGDWSQSLNLYIIFELPTGVSDAFVDAYVYDDDLDLLRDRTSLGYWDEKVNGRYEYTHSDYSWIPWGSYISHGYAWSFDTAHFDQHIVADFVMPAINGTSSTWSAANALVKLVDDVTCFGNPRPLGDTWCVLYPSGCAPDYDNRNQCTNIANLFVAFNRSAGIPSRTVWTDWLSSTFDHSTEVWAQGPTYGVWGWYVGQGYAGNEYGNPDSDQCASPRFSGGYTTLTSTYGWYGGEGVYVAGENWTWDDLDGGGWPGGDDFRLGSWDKSQIVKKDWYETRFRAYWGWSSEPYVTGSPPADWPWPSYASEGLDTSSVPESPPAEQGREALSTTSEEAEIKIGPVVADYGVDEDGDGRFDRLVFEIEVNAPQAGDYWVRGLLGGDYSVAVGGSPIETIEPIRLAGGSQRVELSFEGKDLYLSRADGPYYLEGVWISDGANPAKSDFAERALAYAEPVYESSEYGYRDFGLVGASLTGDYSRGVLDTDGDGWADALVVETGLDVARADTYTVQGILYDGRDRMLSQVSWSGQGPQVRLQFEGLGDTEGPYSLKHLHVRNAAGVVTDGIREPYELGELPELSAKPVSLGVETSVSVTPAEIEATFVITDGYLDVPVDTDGDGQYDQLVIMTTVEVEPGEGGQAYRVEGWLVDENDNLITWAGSDASVLSEGVHTLSLAFDGRIIRERGLDGPYKVVALKALPGDVYDVLNEVDVAYTTSAYSHTQFEEPTAVQSEGIFEDDMESGAGNWTAESPWSLGSSQWHSYNHAWEADASGTGVGSLTTISLDLSDYTSVTARFSTCYAMQSPGDEGYVEVSTNGVEWIRLATYTDLMPHWSTSFVDLSGFDKEPAVQLRFSASAQDSLRWYVDDVYLSGRSGTFTYLPVVLKK
jgi:hypothetical protein